MASKTDLPDWVEKALKELGGSGTIVAIAQIIWRDHESELTSSGDLFFTWHYDMRWAANKLRHQGKMKAAELSPRGVWELR
jgi:hypothetical protein